VNLSGNPEAIKPAEKQAKELGRKLVEAIQANWKDPEQQRILDERKEYFKRMIMFNKDLWKHEYDYWKGMGEL
jgi:hypothetical protein